MKIDGVPYRSIWVPDNGTTVRIIDQTKLPHAFVTRDLHTLEDAAHAIKAMLVRGAPLIGATAAYGMALSIADDASDARIAQAYDLLYATRPTAVNLRWALDDMRKTLLAAAPRERHALAYQRAGKICDEDVAINDTIGEHGLIVLRELWRHKGEKGTLNLLTHCNAGWLATVDWGTALAPIYKAHEAGIPIHVWVDETRPRNQGASLTAWELGRHGVPHTVIADNVGGHLMQHGMVDMCITGTDRTTASGDVCNKIGTYLKALAAHDNGVPFYVALPGPTIDWTIGDGLKEIPIEQRDPSELTKVVGRLPGGEVASVSILPDGSTAANYAFDVTPARLVTGLITERGVAEASREGLASLFPELAAASAT